jgi:hypothetical protein
MNNPVTAFKPLGPNEYVVTPFKAYAPFSYTYTSASSTNSSDLDILYGVKYSTASGLRVENSTQEVFDSVVQTFYSAIPYTFYGIDSASYKPTGSVFVISVTQDVFGEEILPGSFNVSIGASSAYDDSKGNLIISNTKIGRIFYDKGIAVLRPTSSISGGGLTTNGICIVSGTSVNVSFSSSIMLHEHSVKLRLNPTDFNFSGYNPTTQKQFYTGSSITPLESMVSRSMNPLSDVYVRPYITSIGLYNANDEMVAVAKLSNPIQRTFDSKQTFIVKFDT